MADLKDSEGSQTPRPSSRIQKGIVISWGNKWNPLLRRPRKTFRHTDMAPTDVVRRSSRNRSSAVRSRFSFFINAAKSSHGSGKSTQTGRSEPTESVFGEEEEYGDIDEAERCAADIAYQEGLDFRNPYHADKSRLMRQYHIWNGVDLKKIGLPPLPTPERQRTTFADAWKNTDQAARQLGNITRRGPQRALDNRVSSKSLEEWSSAKAEMERQETSVRKMIRDAVCHGVESHFMPTSRPKTAPGVVYDPRTTWTVKCMQEARMDWSWRAATRASGCQSGYEDTAESDTGEFRENDSTKNPSLGDKNRYYFINGGMGTPVSKRDRLIDCIVNEDVNGRSGKGTGRNTPPYEGQRDVSYVTPVLRRSISSCGRYNFKHAMKMDSHHLSSRQSPRKTKELS